MILLQNGKTYFEHRYTLEEDLEKEIVKYSKLLFGKNIIYIDAKSKIESKALGGSVPDGFLFDLKDIKNPEFYIVEVELQSHDFYKHIFPQITKFFAFFKNKKSQTELIEKLFSTVNSSQELKDEFKVFLGDKEIYKFIKDVLENSQNILLLLDGNKNELPEIIETYADTWGKMVKVLLLKKFTNRNDVIYSLDPDFANIEYPPGDEAGTGGGGEYSEEFHLDGVDNETKEIYSYIKEILIKFNKDLLFNPQKYYISIILNKNVAYFQLRRKKIRLVILLPEKEVRTKIRKHEVIRLSKGVQKFYNAPSCSIIIDDMKNVAEVISILKYVIKKAAL